MVIVDTTSRPYIVYNPSAMVILDAERTLQYCTHIVQSKYSKNCTIHTIAEQGQAKYGN